MTNKLLLILADLHGGHKLGLLRPGTMVWGENAAGEEIEVELTLNPLQEFLYDTYRESLEWVYRLAAGRQIIVKVNGDVTQGKKYPREWVSTRESDQFAIATGFLNMVLEVPGVERLDFVIGTGSHEFEEGSAPLMLTKMLQPTTSIPVSVSNHALIEVNGVVFDIAHHGPPPGSRRWLEGNGLRWYTNDIQQRELDLDRRPPDWVIRSHYHTAAEATSDYRKGTTFHKTGGILTPGMTGLDAYGRQATRSKYEVHVGVVAFEIDADGKTRRHFHFQIIDTRRKEIIR